MFIAYGLNAFSKTISKTLLEISAGDEDSEEGTDIATEIASYMSSSHLLRLQSLSSNFAR
jgi:hypothetical protein